MPQLQFEMVELHKDKAKFTLEQALIYPLTSAFIYKQTTLAMLSPVLLR